MSQNEIWRGEGIKDEIGRLIGNAEMMEAFGRILMSKELGELVRVSGGESDYNELIKTLLIRVSERGMASKVVEVRDPAAQGELENGGDTDPPAEPASFVFNRDITDKLLGTPATDSPSFTPVKAATLKLGRRKPAPFTKPTDGGSCIVKLALSEKPNLELLQKQNYSFRICDSISTGHMVEFIPTWTSEPTSLIHGQRCTLSFQLKSATRSLILIVQSALPLDRNACMRMTISTGATREYTLTDRTSTWIAVLNQCPDTLTITLESTSTQPVPIRCYIITPTGSLCEIQLVRTYYTSSPSTYSTP